MKKDAKKQRMKTVFQTYLLGAEALTPLEIAANDNHQGFLYKKNVNEISGGKNGRI